MPARRRANPLALAVLVSLFEEPLHPYEIATRLKARKKHESVRLNYGSLYAVVDSLARAGWIRPRDTEQTGHLPPRTIYELTDLGRTEMEDWLSDLVSTPQSDYPNFEAALSFLPALPPDTVLALLETRVQALELALAEARAARQWLASQGFPRLLWLEAEFHSALRSAELDYARHLIQDIRSDRLEGLDWWRSAYANTGEAGPPKWDQNGSNHDTGGEGLES